MRFMGFFEEFKTMLPFSERQFFRLSITHNKAIRILLALRKCEIRKWL